MFVPDTETSHAVHTIVSTLSEMPPPPHLCCCCYLLLCSMLITGKVKAKGQGREDFRYETTRAKYRVSQTGTFYKE